MGLRIEDQIKSLVEELENRDFSNPRVKAIVKTKLQEALLFSRELENKDF